MYHWFRGQGRLSATNRNMFLSFMTGSALCRGSSHMPPWCWAGSIFSRPVGYEHSTHFGFLVGLSLFTFSLSLSTVCAEVPSAWVGGPAGLWGTHLSLRSPSPARALLRGEDTDACGFILLVPVVSVLSWACCFFPANTA